MGAASRMWRISKGTGSRDSQGREQEAGQENEHRALGREQKAAEIKQRKRMRVALGEGADQLGHTCQKGWPALLYSSFLYHICV